MLTSLLALLITLGSMLRSRLDLQFEILARAIKSESSNTLFISDRVPLWPNVFVYECAACAARFSLLVPEPRRPQQWGLATR